MALSIPTTVRNALCDLLADRFDAGGAAGEIEIRDGVRPATANDAATGNVLATVALAATAFGAAANGTATLADPAAVSATGAGTATWFRALDSAGVTVCDGSVTATGGGGDLTLATTTISVGLSVDITGGSITMPAGG
ncbi:hypothetical protein [Pseudonocardia parietis]|uniref:Uncharacterized protein n=1 Tax=Pseudonocardia parietis TaxID=570936 RepID=A0ABS4W3D2_9PSEU|nr:hypothetical protein [Pseudonocardia parietis]MBP2370194.1 hypothetical protein [Pseudonocardia parietis]